MTRRGQRVQRPQPAAAWVPLGPAYRCAWCGQLLPGGGLAAPGVPGALFCNQTHLQAFKEATMGKDTVLSRGQFHTAPSDAVSLAN